MGKVVKAISPFITPTGSNFKLNPYNAWVKCGGKIASAQYPWRAFNRIVHNCTFPSFLVSKREVRLRFVEASSMNYDAFPDYITYEIIPFVWDCWPRLDDKVVKWLKKCKVKACVFTSREAAARIQKRLPKLNILVVTEGIDTEKYGEGALLKDRTLDVFYFGRAPKAVSGKEIREGLTFKWGGTDEEFFECLKNGKVTNAFPQCDAKPIETGGQETLTQRYWECMLSRIVMIGRAPKELIDLIGYNPVVPLNVSLDSTSEDVSGAYNKQLREVLDHIDDYQELVNKNRETALRMAPWEIRMKQVMEWLTSLGYEV